MPRSGPSWASRALIDAAWRNYDVLHESIPDEPTVGASVMVHLAAMTVAFYGAMRATGMSDEAARDRSARLNWGVYERLTKPTWSLTALLAKEPIDRVKRAMDLFMRFPYASPGYEMAYVVVEEGTVGFDVRRCPASEFFAALGLQSLCKAAFCDLDYPLAENWGVTLTRTKTLSCGKDHCDFRFAARDRDGSPART